MTGDQGQHATDVRTRWLHILFGGCKDHDPAHWCNGCFYRAWNKLHPDRARTNYDPKFKPYEGGGGDKERSQWTNYQFPSRPSS